MLPDRIWFTPPLAIARVGASSTPQVAFSWSANDLRPRGSARTTLATMETINVASDGTPILSMPTEILFRDAEGVRPVAPFFELNASWSDAAGMVHSGPVTIAKLSEWGVGADAIIFDVHLANLKAFHYTQDVGDRVEARVHVTGTDHRRVVLLASSPPSANPLVPTGTGIPFGTFQILKPTTELPEFRVRLTPPAGLTYGPSDMQARIAALDYDFEDMASGTLPNAEWRNFVLPATQLFLNPSAAWARWVQDLATLPPFGERDGRNNPGGLLAAPFETIPWAGGAIHSRSLGLIDDVSDGTITATLQISGTSLMATARVAVGPPDFSPASRTPVSLADNLTDREGRGAMRAASWTREELSEIIHDIFERAFETSDLIHRDYQNARSANTNRSTQAELGGRSPFDIDDVVRMLWPVPTIADVSSDKTDPMVLGSEGSRKHRRYASLEYLEDRFRENPALFDQWLRRPADPNPFFDRRMPALMRGSDGRPFHLTRWQWELIRRWIVELRKETVAAGAPGPIAPPPLVPLL